MAKRNKSGVVGFLSPQLLILLVLLLLIPIIGLSLNKNTYPKSKAADTSTPQVYWGATIKASDIGVTGGDPPWNMAGITKFESDTGKKMSIYHWGTAWYVKASYWPYDAYVPFQPTLMDNLRNAGYIPLFSWQSAVGGLGRLDPGQATMSLSRITNGSKYGYNCDTATNTSCVTYDQYVRGFATAAKNWGHPFFMRFDWEMNGNWFAWSEKAPWNSAGQFVPMWQHVKDIFDSVGATNVTWVWCPNITSDIFPMTGLYPGDSYVDWTCMDGYNMFGSSNNSWMTFPQLFNGKDAGISWLHDTYQELLTTAPSKPILLGELASNEAGDGGTKKAAWITDAIQTQIPNNFPQIKAAVWFNWNSDSGSSYIVESSAPSQSAFASAIALGYYATNNYNNLPLLTKVMPLPSAIFFSPTPTLTPTPTPNSTPAPSDTIPPVVTITSPVSGAVFARKTNVTVFATATDNVGVDKVQFYQGTSLICTDGAAPYSCSIFVGSAPGKQVVLKAVAYDTSGNTASSQVTVTTK